MMVWDVLLRRDWRQMWVPVVVMVVVINRHTTVEVALQVIVHTCDLEITPADSKHLPVAPVIYTILAVSEMDQSEFAADATAVLVSYIPFLAALDGSTVKSI